MARDLGLLNKLYEISAREAHQTTDSFIKEIFDKQAKRILNEIAFSVHEDAKGVKDGLERPRNRTKTSRRKLSKSRRTRQKA